MDQMDMDISIQSKDFYAYVDVYTKRLLAIVGNKGEIFTKFGMHTTGDDVCYIQLCAPDGRVIYDIKNEPNALTPVLVYYEQDEFIKLTEYNAVRCFSKNQDDAVLARKVGIKIREEGTDVLRGGIKKEYFENLERFRSEQVQFGTNYLYDPYVMVDLRPKLEDYISVAI